MSEKHGSQQPVRINSVIAGFEIDKKVVGIDSDISTICQCEKCCRL